METNINPLIELFYLFGLSPETVKNKEHYKENNFLKPEFLKPELLSKFPPFLKPYIEIKPNIILSHCFPKGFQILESITVPRDEFLHFKIDNIPSRNTKNKYIYYTCLIFYESLITYYNIQKLINNDKESNLNIIKMKKQQFESQSNSTGNINKSYSFYNYYIPKVICFCSFVPFPYEFEYILQKLKEYSTGQMGKALIPIEKAIENLVLTIPRPVRGRFNIKLKKDYFLLNGGKNDLEICQRDFNQYNFHSYRYQLIFIFSVENIIEIYKSLLLEIPLIFFSNDKDKLTNIVSTFLELLSPFRYQYPNVTILPENNLGIIEHAKSFVLGINEEWINAKNGENFFTRKNIILFNKPIRICDIDKQKIDLYYNKKDANSVITFEDLGKVNNNLENATYYNNNSEVQNSNFEINNFKIEDNCDKINYQLPVHYTAKLRKKLNNFLKEKFGYNDYEAKINRKIGKDIFYYFLASILQNYNQFLFNTEKEVESINAEIFKKSIHNIPIENLFKLDDFLYDNKKEERDFYIAFINTIMFRNFLERKYINSESDKFLFLHFDETILIKKNKKFFNKKSDIEFLGNKELETKSWYLIEKKNNPTNFNKQEMKILKEKRKYLYQYYQIFSEKDYKYYLFPILLYDNIFFGNEQYKMINHFSFNNLDLKACLQESSNILNIISSKSNNKLLNIYNSENLNQFKHNPANSLYEHEIENSVYLLWLKVFCMTFYYCDNIEKQLRFYEMLKIIRKLYYIKDNILSLILVTLEKYGDDSMIIEFFDYIKFFSYADYACLCNGLVNTKIKRKNIVLKKMAISNTGINLCYYKDTKESQFNTSFFSENNNLNEAIRRRTIYRDTDPNINSEEKEFLIFDSTIYCINCGKQLDIIKMTLNFDEMKKFETLTCISCQKEIQPKIRVRIGENYYTFTLYEPYYLYSNFSTNIMNIYGNEVNLDALREKYLSFLYGCCWYFKLKNLSSDMMFKYKRKKEEIFNKKEETINKNKKKRKARFISLEIEKTNE